MSSTMPASLSQLPVTIVGEVNVVTQRVMVRDQTGSELEVIASYLPKGSGLPMPGERWLCEKRYGRGWSLMTMVGVEPQVEVQGDRETDVSSILMQILEALAARGIVIDNTVFVPEEPLDDTTDPEPVTTPGDYDSEYEVEENDQLTPEVTPDLNPEDPDDHGTENVKPEPQGKFSYLTLGTYNCFFGLGAVRVTADWNRMKKTRLDLLCMQESDSGSRDAFFASVAADPEWDVYRPGGGGTHIVGSTPRELPILWRVDALDRTAGDFLQLAETIPGQAGRWCVWSRFKHKESGLKFTVFNVHLSVLAIRLGTWDNIGYPARVAQYKHCLDVIVGLIQDASVHGPVFVEGDFNYHWERAVKLGKVEGSPMDRFSAQGMTHNWIQLGMPETPSRKGSGWIDYIWFKPDAVGGLSAVWQKVLAWTHSDHNLVLVTYKIKSRIKHPKNKGKKR